MKTMAVSVGLLVVAALGCGGEVAGNESGLTTSAATKPYVPKTRTYFIAAEEVEWDYAPSGKNLITGQPFDDTANVFVQQGPQRIGHVYRKALYREYTDATFRTPKDAGPAWKHLGMLGPVIRGVVGDTIVVEFLNRASQPTSVHPHGVFYDKGSEGASYDDGTPAGQKGDGAVPPGGRWTYTWKVPERAGPAMHDGSSVMWMYHSHVDEPGDTNAGLMGPMIITSAAAARADGTPNDVDRELVTVFSVVDENASWLLDANIQEHAGVPASVNPDDPEFQESNLMHSINGYVYGNLPGLDMKVGQHVRWYLMGMGTEVDLHTPHWHGNTVTAMDMRTDVVSLLPATMITADMVPDDPGKWLFHCHVNDHISAGMMATYTVSP